VYAQALAFPPKESVGHLQQNARTISRLGITATRAPVRQITQNL
jgi:hypothetical protein